MNNSNGGVPRFRQLIPDRALRAQSIRRDERIFAPKKILLDADGSDPPLRRLPSIKRSKSLHSPGMESNIAGAWL